MTVYRVAWDQPINEHAARLLAVTLCEFACNGSRGRPEHGDAVYDAVTEHRDFGAGYSSCADLAHWMLFRLGVREGFINRREHRGFAQGVNLSRLAWCKYSRAASARDRYEPGDILVVWSRTDTLDAHVTVVLRDSRTEAPAENRIETANYGSPGGAIKTSAMRYTVSLAVLGSRPIRRWIPLAPLLVSLQEQGRLQSAEDPTRTEDGTLIWRPSNG
jgi:hypothetical protein